MAFGKNIKKIRSVKKLSQTAFAELFGLKRSSIGAYEEERAEPKLDVIIRIAKYFKISIDNLVDNEITVNELVNFHLPHELLNNNKLNTNNKIQSIALLESKHLLLKSLEQAILKSDNQISLPYIKQNDIAINIDLSHYNYVSKQIQNKDIIIIDSKFDFRNEKEGKDKLYLIKYNENLCIGDIKIIKEDEIILFNEMHSPTHINIEDIDILVPIEKHIHNNLKVNNSESERIKKLEYLINDLYKRI